MTDTSHISCDEARNLRDRLTRLEEACRLFIGARMTFPDDIVDGWSLNELHEAYVRVKTVLEGA